VSELRQFVLSPELGLYTFTDTGNAGGAAHVPVPVPVPVPVASSSISTSASASGSIDTEPVSFDLLFATLMEDADVNK
jgi:hypothetical protein